MTGEPNRLDSDLPWLRIRHLLIYGVVAATLFALLPRLLIPDVTGGHNSILALRVIGVVSLSLALLSIYWRARGYLAFAQPGQWILLTSLVQAVGQIPSQVMEGAFPDVGPWSKSVSQWDASDCAMLACILCMSLAGDGLPAAIFVWGFRRVADTQLWRMCFLVLALRHLFWIALELHFLFLLRIFDFGNTTVHFMLASWGIAVLLVTALAIGDDIYRKRQRSWTHWAGASLLFIGCLLGLVGSLIQMIAS